MKLKHLFIAAIFGAATGLALTSAASASPWTFHHARRAEVNHRLAHQDMRIDKAYRRGRISAYQAHYLHREDRMIRRRERFDARHDDGHITGFEQHHLNQAENRVSHQINRTY